MKLSMGAERLSIIKEEEKSGQWYVICICHVIYNKCLYTIK